MSRSDLRLSLRLRILAVLCAALSLGALVLGMAAYHWALEAAGEAYDRLLKGGTIQIAENVYVQGGVVTLEPPVAALATLSAYDRVFYKVVDARGVVVAGYEDLSVRAGPRATRAGVVLEDGTYQGEAVRIASISRRLQGAQDEAWATIAVAQSVEARRALAWNLTLKALAVIAGMSVLALLAAGLAVRFALGPLLRLEAEIAGRRPDDLKPIEARPPHEVRNLVHAIDDFMQRLSRHLDVMQRFIADAAHQIRTPLAALDAQLEVLSHLPMTGRASGVVERVRERTNELARLTSQLLDHATMLHRANSAATAPVDLNALAEGLLATAVPMSLEREVEVAFLPCDRPAIVKGDAVSLREALLNLIDNAFAHGARSRLSVAVGMSDGEAWITVCDDGHGFAGPAGDLTAPFAKGAASKGSGLGLAIAADVVQAHGGSLRFDRENGLTCVRILLPTAAAEPIPVR